VRRVDDEQAAAQHAKASVIGLGHRQAGMQPALLGQGLGGLLQALRQLQRFTQINLRVPHHHHAFGKTGQRLAGGGHHGRVIGLDLVAGVHQQHTAPAGRWQLALDAGKTIALAHHHLAVTRKVVGQQAMVGGVQLKQAQLVLWPHQGACKPG